MNKKTIRIAGWALGLSMAVAGIGATIGSSMESLIETKAIDAVYSTLVFGDGGSTTSYTSSFSETDSAEKTWTVSNFNNNNWGWSSSVTDADKSIKCGRKDYTSVATIQNATTLSSATFTSVDLYISSVKNINSIKIYGGTTSSSVTTELASKTSSFSGSTSTPTSLSISKPSGYNYYKIAFDMAKGANGSLVLDMVVFHHEAADPSVDTLAANEASYRLLKGDSLDLTTCVSASGPNKENLTFEITDGSTYGTLDGNVLTGTATGSVAIHAFFAGTDPLVECSFSVVVYQLATFTKITSSSSLNLWSTYAIGTTDGTGAMSAVQSNNNRAKVTSSASETSSFTQDEDGTIGEFILVPGAAANQYAFVDANTGKALYAAGSGSNYLRSQDAIDGNASFTITIDSVTGVASISANGSNTNNILRYNSSSSIFSCYGSGQKDVSLYKSNQTLDLPSADIANDSFEFAADIKAEVADQDKDTGTCRTAYGTYKDSYNAFNGFNKAIIREHLNSDIVFARNRFQAWANYMEGSPDAAWDGESFSPSPAAMVGLAQNKDTSLPLIIAILSAGVLAAGGFSLIQRKRRDQE